MTLRFDSVVIDSTNPSLAADFWEAALGYARTYQDDDEICLEPARDSAPAQDSPTTSPTGPGLTFLRVPESKSVKNRLHLDLRPDDRDAEVARLEALGARRIDVGQGPDVTWVVLEDPDGNEFCVLRALRAGE
ncbi:VOC family protein [Pseudarthrobacter sp. J1763]|uniref:VOC family protein n=1 Tax=Pseudarthrobacter sp. J1763 TaxID=3420445 RepID=UPI003D26F8A6